MTVTQSALLRQRAIIKAQAGAAPPPLDTSEGGPDGPVQARQQFLPEVTASNSRGGDSAPASFPWHCGFAGWAA